MHSLHELTGNLHLIESYENKLFAYKVMHNDLPNYPTSFIRGT